MPYRPTAFEGGVAILSLLDSRPHRDKQGLYWTEGVRAVCWAVRRTSDAAAVVWSPRLCVSRTARKAVRSLAGRGVPIDEVSPETFRSLSHHPHASGVGLVMRQRWTPLGRLRVRPDSRFLVVETVNSAGNLGTMLRTAEAAGAAAVICVGPNADPFSPACVRASMGSVSNIRLCRTSAASLADWCGREVVELLAMCPRGKTDWRQVPRDGRPIAVAVGEERRGLSDDLRAACTRSVRLPVRGQADSLNVAVAAGVMLYASLP